jgi:hypothetical protein
MSSRVKQTALTALALCWLVAIVAGFWWFQARLIVSFDADQRILEQFPRLGDYGAALAQEMPANPEYHRARVIIVKDPQCQCNRYSADHLAALQTEYGTSTTFDTTRLSDLPVAMRSLIPATPFVLIQRPGGALVYAGPVNSGITCTANTSFLETVLQRPVDTALQIPLLARGCYCANQSASSS